MTAGMAGVSPRRQREPRHGILGDHIHGGTVLQGLLANRLVEALNAATSAHLAPLSEADILENAGLVAAA